MGDVEQMLSDVPTTIAISETDRLRVLVENAAALGVEIAALGFSPPSAVARMVDAVSFLLCPVTFLRESCSQFDRSPQHL